MMHGDDTMARVPRLKEFCQQHALKMTTIKDLIRYCLQTESFVTEVTRTPSPTALGTFQAGAFENQLDGQCDVAFVMGDIRLDRDVLVRVHAQCLTGDVFGSYRCDCGEQLHIAMEMIAKEGTGVVMYLQQERRGIGWLNQLKAHALQDAGCDTVQAYEALGVEPELCQYGIGAQMLPALGLGRMRLITNNPRQMVGLEGYGLQIVDRMPSEVPRRKDHRHDLGKTCERRRRRVALFWCEGPSSACPQGHRHADARGRSTLANRRRQWQRGPSDGCLNSGALASSTARADATFFPTAQKSSTCPSRLCGWDRRWNIP
jgi:3,4-dihydroxy 2-butanone 4-phosphate synthase / GTP cyclohydrolase II